MATEITARQADEHEAFSAYLISLFKPKDAKEFDDTIAKLSAKEINDLYKQFKTMEGITFAKMGAKLDYLQRLNGKCPEGYEIEKHMAGGCVKCRKKLLKNTPLMEMCGGKVKKRISKKEIGGTADNDQMSNEGNYGIAKNNKKTSIKFGKNSNIFVNSAECGGKMKERISKKEKGSAFKPIQGGPGMSDSTRGAKLNPKQSKATKGKKRI